MISDYGNLMRTKSFRICQVCFEWLWGVESVYIQLYSWPWFIQSEERSVMIFITYRWGIQIALLQDRSLIRVLILREDISIWRDMLIIWLISGDTTAGDQENIVIPQSSVHRRTAGTVNLQQASQFWLIRDNPLKYSQVFTHSTI